MLSPPGNRAAGAILVLALLLATPRPASAQDPPAWSAIPGAPIAEGRFDDVKFVDAEYGWVVSTRGEIWHTPDGGRSWIPQVQDGEPRFRSAAFFDRSHGFAGTVFTEPHPLWETSDGGQTWHDATWRIIGPRPTGICGMWVINEYQAVGVGAFHGDPIFVKTINGGSEWYSKSLSDVAAALIDVRFLNERVGFATGGTGSNLNGNAVVLRTDDGGFSWRIVHETTRDSRIRGEWGWKISFPTDQVGYVSVEYSTGGTALPAKILKTTDGGRTWSERHISGSLELAGLQGIGFLDENVGWASGRGTTSVTTDGGESWTQLFHYNPESGSGELDGAVNRFHFVNDSLAFAVGSRIYLLGGDPLSTAVEEAAGRGVPRDGPAMPFDILSAYPNPTSGPVTLPLQLDQSVFVRVWIIDLLGRPVRTIVRDTLPAGRHDIAWDGLEDDGSRVAPGAYIALFDIGTATEMKQVLVVR